MRRQRTLLSRLLRVCQRRRQQQAKKNYIKKDVRPLGPFFLALAGAFGDFFDDLLVQATIRAKPPALVMNLLQERFPSGIDKRHPAKVDVELFLRRSGAQVPPKLFQRRHRLAGKPTLDR